MKLYNKKLEGIVIEEKDTSDVVLTTLTSPIRIARYFKNMSKVRKTSPLYSKNTLVSRNNSKTRMVKRLVLFSSGYVGHKV